MRGLEIGPLYRPRVSPDHDVRYVDHYSTEELRAGYAVNAVAGPFIDEIVDVDYVLRDGATIASATKADAPFDYVVASHVIEHVVDPIGWLRDIREILAPQGLISLVVPDKRFCFDVNRDLTAAQDWIDWFLRGLEAPSFAQLFDFFAHVTTLNGSVDTAALWAGPVDYRDVRRSDVADPDADALAACIKHRETGEYKDIHAGVYTPESFLGLLRLAMKLELLDFEVAHFESTPVNTLEFYVTLRRTLRSSVDSSLRSVDRALAASRRAPRPPRSSFSTAPSAASNASAALDASVPGSPDRSAVMTLSRKEQTLIALEEIPLRSGCGGRERPVVSGRQTGLPAPEFSVRAGRHRGAPGLSRGSSRRGAWP